MKRHYKFKCTDGNGGTFTGTTKETHSSMVDALQEVNAVGHSCLKCEVAKAAKKQTYRHKANDISEESIIKAFDRKGKKYAHSVREITWQLRDDNPNLAHKITGEKVERRLKEMVLSGVLLGHRFNMGRAKAIFAVVDND